VKLTIATKPAQWTVAEYEQLNIRFARYYQADHELTEALQAAQKALKANRHSIPARILAGELQEAQGHAKDALASYETTLAEFWTQYPHSYEPPVFLIYKSNQMRQKLESDP
jgi:lipopolysaccharide biosynthesis regulator YciM